MECLLSLGQCSKQQTAKPGCQWQGDLGFEKTQIFRGKGEAKFCMFWGEKDASPNVSAEGGVVEGEGWTENLSQGHNKDTGRTADKAAIRAKKRLGARKKVSKRGQGV